MAERWQDEGWAKDLWWSGKTTRRRFLGLSATAAGASSAGRATTVQPAARAVASFRASIDTGKFHGVKAATTPTGS